MLDQHTLATAATRLFANIAADEAELIATTGDTGATRFSNNAISQNMEESTSDVRLRVVKNGRQAIATGNSLTPAALEALARRALAASAHTDADPSLLPMLDKQPAYRDHATPGFDEATAAADPAYRAAEIAKQVAKAKANSLEAAGLFTTKAGACFYANSHGVRAFHRGTTASFTMSAFADNGNVEGSGDVMARTLSGLDPSAAADEAIDRALRGRSPTPVKPGAYDVVLTPGALSDLLLFISWLGFGTQAHTEGRSGLQGKLGTRVFAEQFTVRSDPFDPRHHARNFDFEGFPKKPLNLIEAGIPTDLPHDRRTAAKLKTINTGHANMQPDGYGPLPSDIVVEGGNSTVQKMIESTGRGLYVSQFHYTNAVDPMSMTVTGMTRGGVWMIENGKLGHPVTNMRFTESLIRAFANIEAIEATPILKAGGLFGGGMVLPAMKVRDFTFSSSTGF